MCLGHLAEAADALCLKHADLAMYLREEYLAYDKEPGYRIQYNDIFIMLDRIDNDNRAKS